MSRRARIVGTLALLVLAGCTGGGGEQEPEDEPSAAPPPPITVADLPARAQVREEVRLAARGQGGQSLPSLPDNPVVGSWYSLVAAESRCVVTYGWDSAEDDCVFGDPEGDQEIVLWGDEQAAQWLPGLSLVAAETGHRLRVVTKYECPPLADLTPWLPTENRAHVECRTFNDRVLDSLAADPPETVVVSGAIRGTAFVVDGQVVETGRVFPGNRWRPTPGSRDIWHEGFGRSMSALAELDLRTVVLGEVPAPGLDPGVCVWRNRDELERCSVRREEVALEDHARVVKELTREQGASYVDTTKWLCTRVCPAVAGDTITYRDSVLVTRQYAERMARVLGEETGLLPEE